MATTKAAETGDLYDRLVGKTLFPPSNRNRATPRSDPTGPGRIP
ncbi:hypothetical protein [Gordonibacter massiliensis (ex Traore et al. 2017)]|nr:hypothetical protein [Gordonibacter massiliensis (ex Traore et al. 2017)]